jgi:hypothetical protein
MTELSRSRRSTWAAALAFVGATMLAMGWFAAPAGALTLTGTVSEVVDGDTIKVATGAPSGTAPSP